MKPTQNRDQRLGVYKDSFGNSFDVVQIQNGDARIWEGSVARHRDDALVGYMEWWTPEDCAKNLQFRMRFALESLDHDKITGGYPFQELS